MSIPSTMRALQQTSLNGPQDLRLITDAPVPRPGPGEVLIRVTAAGVNYVDISQARGTFAGVPTDIQPYGRRPTNIQTYGRRPTNIQTYGWGPANIQTYGWGPANRCSTVR
jgi:hypothetical protein